MRELLAPLVPLLLLVFITSIPHFFRTATGPDHYLFKGVPVCLLGELHSCLRRSYQERPLAFCVVQGIICYHFCGNVLK
jgi:hypothetical protein